MTIRNKAVLMATAALIAGALGPQTAFADGTLAGTTLTNTATIAYKVNSTPQTDVASSQGVTVDRKIVFTVTDNGMFTPAVTPGQTNAVQRFDVFNQSNATLDFATIVTQYASGMQPANLDPDSFDVLSPALYEDTNSNGTYDSGIDLAIAHIDEMAPDTERTIFYVASIPSGVPNMSHSFMLLSLKAHDGNGAGVLGAAAVENTGANTAGLDTVFADEAGDSDAARDGMYTRWRGFYSLTAVFTIDRYSETVSNPYEGAAAPGVYPKGVPGAVVEYCMTMDLAGTGRSASNVSLVETLPNHLTFDTSFGVLLNDSVDQGMFCKTTGNPAVGTSTYDAGSRKLTVTFPSIDIGEVRTVLYRAIVD